MTNNKIMLFNENGEFYGFYDDKDVTDSILSEHEELRRCFISDEIHKYVLCHLPNIKVNIEMIDESETEINSELYFTITIQGLDIDKIKLNLIEHIKQKCGEYIIQGLLVTLPSGEMKEFSFKLEDQINLQGILSNYHDTDEIYYHANGELDTVYSYSDILFIYKSLYNNKLYNQIYSQVLCDWVSENYTEELHNNKDIIITYGYSNEDILERVEKRYEDQKLL